MKKRGLGRGSLRRIKNAKGKWIYVGDWTDARGRRRRQHLSTDKRVAERLLAEIIQQRDLEERGLAVEDGLDLDLQDLKSRYLDDLRQRTKLAHVARVESSVDKILDTIGAARVRDVRKDDVARYRDGRVRAGRSHRTANAEVRCLSAMLNWALKRDLIAVNPLAGLQRLPEGRSYETRPRREFTLEEAKELITASRMMDRRCAARQAAELTISKGTRGAPYAERERSPRVPQTALWMGLMKTGARWGELTRTVWRSVDLAGKTLVIRADTAKNRKQRNHPGRAPSCAS